MDIMNMETFYDIGSSDLKDIWESDLDPSESLKLSADTDMQDWFLERDVKAVILHDKLMSDALLGTLPIKTEHSYSLNSDGDSMPDSPGSLQNKMDDMDDECYPAISMNTATSNSRRLIDTTTQLTTLHSTSSSINSAITTTNIINNNNNNTSACLLNSIQTTCIGSINPTSIQNSINPFNLRSKQHQQNLQHQQLSHQHQQLPQMSNSTATTIDQIYNCSGNSSSASSMSSDIDIDDSCIKDEPMSPADDSSCPPSPINNNSSSYNNNGSNGCTNSGISLNMANMAAITNTDLVFEHKLSPASQSLLKSQQMILPNGTSSSSIATSPQRIILPKVNIKMESQINHHQQQLQQQQQQQQQQQLFGLPPTPPSSLPSDDSEGNQSPEHILLSPMSPPAQQLMSAAGSSGINSPSSSPTGSGGSTRRNHSGGNANIMTSSTTSTSSSSSSSSSGGNSSIHNSSSAAGVAGGRGYTGTSTRQPIHTPLISSQPKGSTGTLILTEEEKRTLLAEGYPIPTRLPLTKAEEKSLKKIRRKIKNKISAQESRRKKKEYMDQLERKVEILVSENTDYRKRVETLEDSNANLLNQLQKLQALVNRQKK